MVVNFARTTVSKELLKQVFQRIDAKVVPSYLIFICTQSTRMAN